MSKSHKKKKNRPEEKKSESQKENTGSESFWEIIQNTKSSTGLPHLEETQESDLCMMENEPVYEPEGVFCGNMYCRNPDGSMVQLLEINDEYVCGHCYKRYPKSKI